jgi:putative tryptophan/tyrosine transport system substrate-binding protein
MIDRRRKLILVCLGAIVVPRPGFAQQKTWRIGVVIPRLRPASLESGISGAFLREMRKLGYVEGSNVQYEWRFTEGRTERLAEQVGDLVRLKVDLIVAASTPVARAAQKATSTIPIVMVAVGDPVGSGLVASLARPGKNITGVGNFNVDVNAKRVELLATAVPKLSRLGALLNPANPTHAANLSSLQAASARAGLTLSPAAARTPDEIEGAFSLLRNQSVDALIVQTDSLFATQARQIAQLAARSRLPTIGPREIVDAGGLIAYAPSTAWIYGRTAAYVDRILKGANPAELSVEQPTKLELIVNLKAAQSLGITIAREVVLLADEVIQ